MKQDDDFFITISSNSSLDFFPNNTLANFSNKCPHPIQLEDLNSWRVALVELQFPINWTPLKTDDLNIKHISNEGSKPQKLQIKLEKIDDISSFGKSIESSINKAHNFTEGGFGVSSHFDDKSGVISLVLKSKNLLEFSRPLLTVLGIPEYSENARVFGENVVLGSSEKSTTFIGNMDFRNGFDTLWVYSNVCSYRMVGESFVPLLRVVPIKKKNTQANIFHKNFYSPQYLPISQSYFHSINLYITDTRGKLIPFRPGQVVATFHLKKK